MYLVEVFVPLNRGDGTPVQHDEMGALVRRLADRFDGATAFSRAPAQGLWKEDTGIAQDRIVIVEVMVEGLDRSWWTAFKEELQRDLQQEQIVVRCTTCEVL